MFDLSPTIQSLAEKRPIFHNEADFQHALAWELHQADPEAQVRLEFRPVLSGRVYIDVWLQSSSGFFTAIELKYPTRLFSDAVNSEYFELRNHDAQDLVRYDFIKDLTRLEQIAGSVPGLSAAAIMLTNDPSYWTAPRSGNQIDAAFRIHEGRLLEGTLAWGDHAGAGTMAKREAPLMLYGSYPLRWQDYSVVNGVMGHFRYLLVNV